MEERRRKGKRKVRAGDQADTQHTQHSQRQHTTRQRTEGETGAEQSSSTQARPPPTTRTNGPELGSQRDEDRPQPHQDTLHAPQPPGRAKKRSHDVDAGPRRVVTKTSSKPPRQHDLAEEQGPIAQGKGKAAQHQQATVHAQQHPRTAKRKANTTEDAQNEEEGGSSSKLQRIEAERSDMHGSDNSSSSEDSCHQRNSEDELHTGARRRKATGHAQEEAHAAGRPQRKRKREEYPGMVGEEQPTVRAARRIGHMDRAGTPSGALKFMMQTGYHLMRRIEEAGGEGTRPPWE